MSSTQQHSINIQFSFHVGNNLPEAILSLEAIKRSMSDVLLQASAVDCSANDETVSIAHRIYRESKKHLMQMKKFI